ncbi:unnamed protein product [Polarella glacialis]|uniref:EF-hand domain-containing protein n=1 Tax=Polarella glacialis TaxID=89957 RepID=A0A813FRM2_POLGL|nr:unnamed protein product [Polarella glacialis]
MATTRGRLQGRAPFLYVRQVALVAVLLQIVVNLQGCEVKTTMVPDDYCPCATTTMSTSTMLGRSTTVAATVTTVTTTVDSSPTAVPVATTTVDSTTVASTMTTATTTVDSSPTAVPVVTTTVGSDRRLQDRRAQAATTTVVSKCDCKTDLFGGKTTTAEKVAETAGTTTADGSNLRGVVAGTTTISTTTVGSSDAAAEFVSKINELISAVKAIFRKSDTDVKAVFRKSDTNNDGRLSIDEMTSLVRALDMPVEYTEAVFKEIDKSGDGFIEYGELTMESPGRPTSAAASSAAPSTTVKSSHISAEAQTTSTTSVGSPRRRAVSSRRRRAVSSPRRRAVVSPRRRAVVSPRRRAAATTVDSARRRATATTEDSARRRAPAAATTNETNQHQR